VGGGTLAVQDKYKKMNKKKEDILNWKGRRKKNEGKFEIKRFSTCKSGKIGVLKGGGGRWTRYIDTGRPLCTLHVHSNH
jgi:hypothetical protein